MARQDLRYRAPDEGKDAKHNIIFKIDWPCYKNAWYVAAKESSRTAMNGNWINEKPNLVLKPKWEINKNTNKQKAIRTNGQPSGQLFPKRLPLSNYNRTKGIMNKHKVNHHRSSDTKTGNRETHQDHRPGTVSYELLVSL